MVPVHTYGGAQWPISDEEYIEQKLCLASKIEPATSVLEEEASAASFCSALHLFNGVSITGQSSTRKQIDTNPILHCNFSQPFVQVSLV
jgi:hypothetical protein